MSQTFGRERRLLTAKDFKQVFDNAKRFRSTNFQALVTQNSQPFSRIGFVIAKRNIAHAVSRNRVRRIVRETFRKKGLVANINIDIVFMVYKTAGSLTNQQLFDECESLWIKLHSHYKQVS